MKTFIVVCPCHFQDSSTLCETTKRRLERAGNIYWSMSFPEILLTEDVSWADGADTLAELARKWLVENSFIEFSHIHVVESERGFSQEVEQVFKMFNGDSEVWVVSSAWHLWVAGFFWKRAAKQYNVPVCFIPVADEAGTRTRIFYGMLACALRGASFLGLLSFFEKGLERRCVRRKNSLRFSGCR